LFVDVVSYSEYPKLEDVYSGLPKLKVFLHRSKNGWANAQRERGTYEAFDKSEPNNNQIVSFLDLASAVRLKAIEQAFKENEDLNQVLGGFRWINVSNNINDQLYNCPLAYLDEYKMFCKPIPEDGFSDEEYEALFKSLFDFRDLDIKMKYYKRIHTFEFLRNLNDPSVVVDDPWDPDKGGLHGGCDFSWWAACRENVSFSDLPFATGFANGHTSWRRNWLINVIKKFPDTRIGEDARLNYGSLLKGGTALGIQAPLTYYSWPTGTSKRSALNNLKEWNHNRDSIK